MAILDNILETIGRTPMVRSTALFSAFACEVAFKVEYFNPGGSVKDRIGLAMIAQAEREGRLKPGGTIVEGTSGNTGMGLALVAAIRGYRCIFTMPDKMSHEKINLLKALGGEVIICPTAVAPDDPRSYYSVAKRLAEEIPNAVYPNQYENPANPRAHYETTGPEIWEQTEGRIHTFLCGLGTGGTVSGIGKYLKEKNAAVRVVGADPIGSLYHEYFQTGHIGEAHTYLVEGIGEDIIPGTIDFSFIDDVVQVTDKECFHAARRLARREGIFTGGSGGAAVAAGLKVAGQLPPDSLMVILLPDTGERYLSKVYNDVWMRENQCLEKMIAVEASEVLRTKRVRGTPRCVSVGPDSFASAALALMKKYEISQLPVLDGRKALGSVSEEIMIELLVRGEKLDLVRIGKVMAEPFPVISDQSQVSKIQEYLTTGHPAVLVDTGEGELDIITKFDLIHFLKG